MYLTGPPHLSCPRVSGAWLLLTEAVGVELRCFCSPLFAASAAPLVLLDPPFFFLSYCKECNQHTAQAQPQHSLTGSGFSRRAPHVSSSSPLASGLFRSWRPLCLGPLAAAAAPTCTAQSNMQIAEHVH
jgi:hypothetical protein